MTFAQTLNALTATLLTWVNTLSAGTPSEQAAAATLTPVVNALITAASDANALALEAMLANDATSVQRLKDFTSQADAAVKQLATDQANVSKFVSLATNIAKVIAAVGAGNLAACGSALASACNDLGIATV